MSKSSPGESSALEDQASDRSNIKGRYKEAQLPVALERRLRQFELLNDELDSARAEVEAQSEELIATQQQLAASEREYGRLYDSAPVGYFTLDRKGVILEANRTGAEMLGLAKSLLIGTPLASYAADMAHGRFYSHLKKAFEGRKPRSCEIKMAVSSGKGNFWARLQSAVVAGDDGEPICLTTISDITEQKKVEDVRRFLAETNTNLARSLDYHKTLANIAQMCVPFLADWCVVDMIEEDGSIERVAVAHVDPAKEELARELQRRYPPPPNSDHIVSAVLRTGKPNVTTEVTDTLLESAARDKRHLKILRALGLKSHMIVPLVSREKTLGAITFASAESGRLYGPEDLALAEELTCRAALAVDNARLYRQATQAAMQERAHVEQLRGLTRSALLINSALSVKSVLHVINEQARLLVGAHQAVTCITLSGHEDANSETITALSLSEKYEQWRRYAAKPDYTGIYSYVCETNQPIRMTQAELEADPRWKGFGKEAGMHPPMRGWLAVPLTTRDGANLGVIQLSDKYEGEFTEEDEAVVMQLAQMASVAITNADLYHQAQEAVKMRDEFLSIASHELRTPLTSLVLQLTNLRRSAVSGELARMPTERVRDRVESTYDQSLRLSKLVNELLDVSRISAGRLELDKEKVDLGGLVREVLDRFDDELKQAGCKAKLNVASPVVGSWDRFRLDQVIANLISNAIKYGRGEPVEITVDQVGDHAILTVRDGGIGIKPEHLDKIFDRFERAVTTRNYGGLGLGLYIVRSILDATGGSIRVESRPGLGSTFTVELPLDRLC